MGNHRGMHFAERYARPEAFLEYPCKEDHRVQMTDSATVLGEVHACVRTEKLRTIPREDFESNCWSHRLSDMRTIPDPDIPMWSASVPSRCLLVHAGVHVSEWEPSQWVGEQAKALLGV